MSKAVVLHLKDMEGVQHCHDGDCDEYYYRPLVYGDDLFSYIAHIPPGGGVPGDQEEADMFEMSCLILSGTATAQYADEKFDMQPYSALHCPRGVPVGFFNRTSEPVSLTLSFTPSPRGAKNPQEMRQYLLDRGRKVWTADEMNAMSGGLGV